MKTLKEKDLIELTKQALQPFCDVKMSDDMAQDSKNNLVGLFELLLSWSEQEEEMIFCNG